MIFYVNIIPHYTIHLSSPRILQFAFYSFVRTETLSVDKFIDVFFSSFCVTLFNDQQKKSHSKNVWLLFQILGSTLEKNCYEDPRTLCSCYFIFIVANAIYVWITTAKKCLQLLSWNLKFNHQHMHFTLDDSTKRITLNFTHTQIYKETQICSTQSTHSLWIYIK